jgi:hypothetical protein
MVERGLYSFIMSTSISSRFLKIHIRRSTVQAGLKAVLSRLLSCLVLVPLRVPGNHFDGFVYNRLQMLVLLEFPLQILGDFFQYRKWPDPQLKGKRGELA